MPSSYLISRSTGPVCEPATPSRHNPSSDPSDPTEVDQKVGAFTSHLCFNWSGKRCLRGFGEGFLMFPSERYPPGGLKIHPLKGPYQYCLTSMDVQGGSALRMAEAWDGGTRFLRLASSEWAEGVSVGLCARMPTRSTPISLHMFTTVHTPGSSARTKHGCHWTGDAGSSQPHLLCATSTSSSHVETEIPLNS